MKVIFKDEALSDLYKYGKTSDRKYKRICKKKDLIEGYQKAVFRMYSVDSTDELKNFSPLHYEKLRHIGLSSVRLVNGKVERLLFKETDNGVEVELIEIDENHYGKKK